MVNRTIPPEIHTVTSYSPKRQEFLRDHPFILIRCSCFNFALLLYRQNYIQRDLPVFKFYLVNAMMYNFNV